MFSCLADVQFKPVKHFELSLTTKIMRNVILLTGSGVSVFANTT